MVLMDRTRHIRTHTGRPGAYQLTSPAMAIFKAMGLGILILVLQFLAPAVFAQAQATVIAVLHGVEVGATSATSLAASASLATGTSHLPRALPTEDPLPQARQITR